MSKRFGRQQKRRMRERIETLERDLNRKEYKDRCNEEIVRRTADVLGSDLISFPARNYEVGSVQYRHLDTLKWYRKNLCDVNSLSDIQDMVIPIIEEIDILKSKGMEIDERGTFHFRLTYNGKPYGYVIGIDAVQSHDIDFITENIAKELAQFIRDGFREKGFK